MNAPKKIWVDSEKEGAIWPCHNGIEYIRADLVDGLVEALGELYEVAKNVEDEGPLGEGWQSDWLIEELQKARAALKALESAEIGRGME